jgi:cation diffusion facilitator family transporter
MSEQAIVDQSRTTAKEKERSVLNGLILGVASLTMGVIAAVLGNSLVLVVGSFRAASEAIATFLAYMSLRQVNKGKSRSYNYGYGKLENISGLVVAGAMMISFAAVLYVAIVRFINPEPVGEVWLGIALTAVTFIANLRLWQQNRRLAQQSASPIMASQAELYRAKTMSNVAVITALLLSGLLRSYEWAAYIDPTASLIFAGMLVSSAYQVANASIFDLLDQALDEVTQVKIMQTIRNYLDHYQVLHGVRSRKSGADVYIEVFLEFAESQPMGVVQAGMAAIQRDLEQLVPSSHVSIVPTTASAFAVTGIHDG